MPRLRFSIRDILWFTLVIGLVLAWWLDSGRQAEERQAERKAADSDRTASKQEIMNWQHAAHRLADELDRYGYFVRMDGPIIESINRPGGEIRHLRRDD